MGKLLLKGVAVVGVLFVAQAHGQEAGAIPEQAEAALNYMILGMACVFVVLVVLLRVME